MICIGHDDSITEETRNAWNGAQTCGFGPLDGNYAPSTVAAGLSLEHRGLSLMSLFEKLINTPFHYSNQFLLICLYLY